MGYERAPLKAPKVAGGALKLVAKLAESSLTGPGLAKKMMRDARISIIRDLPADEACPVHPPLLAAGPEGPPPAPADWTNTDVLAAAAALPASEAPGFSFETAGDFVTAYTEGRTDPEAVAERVLEATAASEKLSPAMRVFIAQRAEDVRALAKASAERYRAGAPLGPLDGVPVAVKDEIDQRPYPTTVGTRFLGKEPVSVDGEPVARLRAAGALLIGKANMHEIGIGVTGLNPHHGAARNPYDPAHATGGSSSGPAAAVAAGLCPLAVGADGGGSIRLPASLCGIVGLKATYGRVSEHGAAPLCWSVAHVGPMAATVRDCALGYAAMAGPDDKDPNTRHQPAPTLEAVADGDLTGKRIGVYRPWFEDAAPEIVAAAQQAVDQLVAAGATIVDVEIPELDLLRSVHIITIVSEMAAAQARYYDAHRKDYGLDTRLNLVLARRGLRAADYVEAQRHRVRLSGHFARALEKADAIATPMTARTSPPLNEKALRTGESDLVTTEQVMRFAPAANLTGQPALSVPVGYDDSGLPMGLQLIGRPWEEHLLLRLAAVVEAAVERRAPKVHYPLLGG